MLRTSGSTAAPPAVSRRRPPPKSPRLRLGATAPCTSLACAGTGFSGGRAATLSAASSPTVRAPAAGARRTGGSGRGGTVPILPRFWGGGKVQCTDCGSTPSCAKLGWLLHLCAGESELRRPAPLHIDRRLSDAQLAADQLAHQLQALLPNSIVSHSNAALLQPPREGLQPPAPFGPRVGSSAEQCRGAKWRRRSQPGGQWHHHIA